MIIKSALVALLVLFLSFVGFVVWMNLTPGHFHGVAACDCGVEYSESPEAICEYFVDLPVGGCEFNPGNTILIYLDILDFNK